MDAPEPADRERPAATGQRDGLDAEMTAEQRDARSASRRAGVRACRASVSRPDAAGSSIDAMPRVASIAAAETAWRTRWRALRAARTQAEAQLLAVHRGQPASARCERSCGARRREGRAGSPGRDRARATARGPMSTDSARSSRAPRGQARRERRVLDQAPHAFGGRLVVVAGHEQAVHARRSGSRARRRRRSRRPRSRSRTPRAPTRACCRCPASGGRCRRRRSTARSRPAAPVRRTSRPSRRSSSGQRVGSSAPAMPAPTSVSVASG